MPRYIDAKEFRLRIDHYPRDIRDIAKKVLRYTPTANVVEVVRCKDCKWYEINELKKDGSEDKRFNPSFCMLHSRTHKSDYYCADGERR